MGSVRISNAEVKATGTTVSRTLGNRFADVLSVKDFGATCDGSADDTTAVQALITALGTTAKTISVPGPTKITSNLVMPSTLRVRFDGDGNFTGTGTVTYTPWLSTPASDVTSTGSTTARSLADRFADITNVLDFGAVGDGVTDDTTAIQAALTAGAGSEVFFPPGTYLLTSAVSIPDGTTVRGSGGNAEGASAYCTTLVNDQATFSFFTGQTNVRIEGFSFQRSGAATVTAGALIRIDGPAFFISDISSSYCWDGIVISGSARQAGGGHITRIDIKGIRNRGLWLDGSGSGIDGVLVSDFYFVATTGAEKITATMISLTDRADALQMVNGYTIWGKWAVYADGSSTVPGHLAFTNVQFDQSTSGVYIGTSIPYTTFQGCWFNTGLSGTGGTGAGVTLDGSLGVSFNGCHFSGCRGHGLVINYGSWFTLVNGCTFSDNNVNANGYSAIYAEANAGSFVVKGNSFMNLGLAGQDYGIYIAAGTSDNYIVADNIFNLTRVAKISDGGSGVNKRVADNYGT